MQEGQKGLSKLISLEEDPESVERDLQEFRQKALALGASMAKIIPADWIDIDDRVRLKCSIPTCPYYDKSLHCPPHSPSLDIMRKTLSLYSKALLFALDITPPHDFSNRSQERDGVKGWSRKCTS